jgi:hypothetical protein
MSTRRSAARAAAAAATRHRCSAHAASGLGRQASGGEDGEQPPGTHVAVGATRRRVSIGHGPALVEDGVTGRTAEFVNGHVVNLRCGSLREHTGCDEFATPLAALPYSPHSSRPRQRQGSRPCRVRARQSAGVRRFSWCRPWIDRGTARGGLGQEGPPRQAAVGGGRWRWSEWPSRWLRRRLWKPQSSRPLSWVVSPPEA